MAFENVGTTLIASLFELVNQGVIIATLGAPPSDPTRYGLNFYGLDSTFLGSILWDKTGDVRTISFNQSTVVGMGLGNALMGSKAVYGAGALNYYCGDVNGRATITATANPSNGDRSVTMFARDDVFGAHSASIKVIGVVDGAPLGRIEFNPTDGILLNGNNISLSKGTYIINLGNTGAIVGPAGPTDIGGITIPISLIAGDIIKVFGGANLYCTAQGGAIFVTPYVSINGGGFVSMGNSAEMSVALAGAVGTTLELAIPPILYTVVTPGTYAIHIFYNIMGGAYGHGSSNTLIEIINGR
jgi:hypothetical protein